MTEERYQVSDASDVWESSTPMQNPRTEGRYLTDESYVLESAEPEPNTITFWQHDETQMILKIHPDSRIELSDHAKPTEAAALCIEAMSHLIQGMVQRAEQRVVDGIVAWLREIGGDSGQAFQGRNLSAQISATNFANAIEAGEWKE